MYLQFGIGDIYARPNGGNLATPSIPIFFGSIQDVGLDISRKLVKLMGQNQGPDDIAASDMDVKGKAGIGQIDLNMFNSLLFGDTISTGEKVITTKEAHSVPASSTYTITVTNPSGHATAITDNGVRYASNGNPLIPVSGGSEALGKYSYVAATGVYTFGSADASAAVLIGYEWTVTTGETLAIYNHLQGYGPSFELFLTHPYQNSVQNGTIGLDIYNGIHLLNVKCSKIGAPEKRDGYLISDFEFEAYPNIASGLWMEWFAAAA